MFGGEIVFKGNKKSVYWQVDISSCSFDLGDLLLEVFQEAAEAVKGVSDE